MKLSVYSLICPTIKKCDLKEKSMKLSKKVLLANMVLGASLMSPMILLAQETTTATPSPTSVQGTTPGMLLKDLRAENKAKREAAKTEAKAKMDVAKAEAKAKREAAKKEEEAFALKTAKDKLAKNIGEAETAIASATSKLAEAKAAGVAATDKASFEAARKLFMEARKMLEKGMRPLLAAPKVAETKTPPPLPPTTPSANTDTAQ